jgi:hypothetical protein
MNKILKPKEDHHFAQVSEQLALTVDALTVKVAKLQSENHYLRRANRVQPHLRLVLRAEVAANFLALWHLGGYRVGRKACRHNGMTNDSWFAGRALLMAARVWVGNGFVTDDPVMIEERIRVTVERAKRDPSVIAYRIPISKRPKGFVK